MFLLSIVVEKIESQHLSFDFLVFQLFGYKIIRFLFESFPIIFILWFFICYSFPVARLYRSSLSIYRRFNAFNYFDSTIARYAEFSNLSISYFVYQSIPPVLSPLLRFCSYSAHRRTSELPIHFFESSNAPRNLWNSWRAKFISIQLGR